MNLPKIFGIPLLLTIGTACAHRVQKGDSIYLEPYGPYPGMRVSALIFPTVSLATEASKIIRVRDLDKPAYPEAISISIPPRESYKGVMNQPWRSCRFTVSITYPDRDDVIYSHVYDLSEFRGTGHPRSKTPMNKEIHLWFGGWTKGFRHVSSAWPALLDYEIHVTIASPSLRSSDELEIESVFTHQTIRRGKN